MLKTTIKVSDFQTKAVTKSKCILKKTKQLLNVRKKKNKGHAEYVQETGWMNK